MSNDTDNTTTPDTVNTMTPDTDNTMTATEKVFYDPDKFITMCLEGPDLEHDEFVNKYADTHKMSAEAATAVIWAGSIYKKYTDRLREKNNDKTCEDCGLNLPLEKYYCGEFGCGKGSWCKKHKYYLCSDCAEARY